MTVPSQNESLKVIGIHYGIIAMTIVCFFYVSAPPPSPAYNGDFISRAGVAIIGTLFAYATRKRVGEQTRRNVLACRIFWQHVALAIGLTTIGFADVVRNIDPSSLLDYAVLTLMFAVGGMILTDAWAGRRSARPNE
jgi:hypothetical protein